jgi:hypothetical protein
MADTKQTHARAVSAGPGGPSMTHVPMRMVSMLLLVAHPLANPNCSEGEGGEEKGAHAWGAVRQPPDEAQLGLRGPRTRQRLAAGPLQVLVARRGQRNRGTPRGPPLVRLPAKLAARTQRRRPSFGARPTPSLPPSPPQPRPCRLQNPTGTPRRHPHSHVAELEARGVVVVQQGVVQL